LKYLFYLGHPAHFHLFRHVMRALGERGHQVTIVIKKKDILEDLLRRAGMPYTNVQEGGRGDGRLKIALGLAARDWRVLRIARAERPNLMIGTSAEIAHAGRLLGIPSIVVNEDDADVVPLFAKLAYPAATHVLAPAMCRVGRWAGKTISYPGYHELAYLHPNHFTPDPSVRQELGVGNGRYFILRFARLNAHHDAGRSGITADTASRLLRMLTPHGRVFITAERELEPEFEPFRIRVDPLRMHDALAFADIYIGDSQTMAAEAAVLGTPSIRFNDFVGEISYLEVLQHTYQLTFGIRTNEPERLFAKVGDCLADGIKPAWAERRRRLLEENVDTAAFITWLCERYPASVQEIRRDPQMVRQFINGSLSAPQCA
jgi:predicted glycosyltransferase